MQAQVKPFTWLVLAIVSIFTLSLNAQNESGFIAEIQFDETSYDFGTIKEGERVAHAFNFTNTSNEPLILIDVKASCGCTVPEWPREPIQPGETAFINVTFNSKNKKGKRNQKVTILANTDPEYTYIYLAGEVVFVQEIPDGFYPVPVSIQTEREKISIEPTTTIRFEETTFDFGPIDEGSIVSHTYTFTNVGNEPLILSNARGSCGCTVPQWPKEPIAPGETASLTVVFNSKNKKGRRSQKVTITGNTNPPQTFIYLTGEVIPKKENDIAIFDFLENETEEKLSSDCFFIFPNPTAEVLKLDMEENRFGQSAVVSIYSKEGQLMAKREIVEINGIIEFSVSHYPAGTYVANVQIGKEKPESHCFVVVD